MFDIGCLNGARINNLEYKLINFALRKSPSIITHSSVQLDFYKNHYPNLYDKAKFIPFGVDVDYFKTESIDTDEKTIVSFCTGKRD